MEEKRTLLGDVKRITKGVTFEFDSDRWQSRPRKIVYGQQSDNHKYQTLTYTKPKFIIYLIFQLQTCLVIH